MAIQSAPRDRKIQYFRQEDPGGCLKDPRQQSSKIRKRKNIDQELSKTSKIIKNTSLSVILDTSEQHHKK